MRGERKKSFVQGTSFQSIPETGPKLAIPETRPKLAIPETGPKLAIPEKACYT